MPRIAYGLLFENLLNTYDRKVKYEKKSRKVDTNVCGALCALVVYTR